MTVAVLKNRLLQLTGSQFDEHEHGARNMLEFARMAEPLVSVDDSEFPAVVHYAGEVGDAEGSPPTERMVIRRDLWRALFDFDMENPYAWNADHERAVPDSEQPEAPKLPRVSPEDLNRWRTEFAESCRDEVDEVARDRLETWREKGLPTRALPEALRGHWNIFMATAVRDLLNEWFREQGLQPPEDLAVKHRVPPRSKEPQIGDLRALIIRCVQVMSRDELEEIRITPSVLLRAGLAVLRRD